ncbi:hypothetical protein [Sphaerobacter sp.]|uniref:hypothetical protein n=1 Tax=Sphaerobacter sp. TaxID=2099654 RepID=UPI001D9293A1|nr:hypothetical protein [Sphaerobacter sp.]MBX5446875.1 hypothetical protein [Sphaerobacter sp.]
MERVAITEGECTLYRPQARFCQVTTAPIRLAIPSLPSALPLAVEHPVATGPGSARSRHLLTVMRQCSTLQTARHGVRRRPSRSGPRLREDGRARRRTAERPGRQLARSRPRAIVTFELRILCDAGMPAVNGGTQVDRRDLHQQLGIVGRPALGRSTIDVSERRQRVTAALAAQQEG